jgi:predicted membrane-bound spermidine synthase
MRQMLSREFEIPHRLFYTGLLVLFVLSGFAGLIYQSIWSHYLGLLLGHAAYAQALVLATFMGGMGLGAALIARYSTHWRNLVRGYAVVELALGAAGLVFHLVFVFLHELLLESLIPALPGKAAVDGLKWSLAITLILPQSILLGMSFPLMSAGIMRRVRGTDGRVLGNLYFTNSIGAAVGALAASFLLVPLVGLPGAIMTAGLLNLLIGVAAWVLSSDPAGRGAKGRERVEMQAPAIQGSISAGVEQNRLLVLLLAGTALSSAVTFVYEIGWIRMLSLAVGTTLHAFELMLAAFIAGLALGGLWIRGRADRFARPLIALGWVQMLMGLCALGSLALYAGGAFEWIGYLMQALAKNDSGYQLYNLGTAAAAIAIMMPAAFFAGATLPLFTSILLRAGLGESVIGKVYAFNTFGAILGVFAAIHLLIPLLGLRDAMILASGIDIAIGIALVMLHHETRRRIRHAAAAAALAVLCLSAATQLVGFDPHRLASGVYRTGDARLPAQERVLFYRDGKTASIALYETPAGLRRISTNGKVDASIAGTEDEMPTVDEPTMVLAAALPLGLHPDPRNAAVIGFGSGLTTHTLLADPRLRRVDTVEIEAKMVEAARGFGERVERAYRDPRSRIVIDDAKAVLSGARQAYDLIVSEPSNPWMAGIGNLFAEEFYQFIGNQLANDGLFVQWLQLYEINEALVGSVLSAMTPHFGDYRAWLANTSDLLIVATRADHLPPLDADRLFQGDLGRELLLAGVSDPAQLALREFADASMLRAMSDALRQPPNSYYRPILTLQAPRTRYRGDRADRIFGMTGSGSVMTELLGVGAPLPLASTLPQHNHFHAEQNSRRARHLRTVLLDKGSDDETSPDTAVHQEAELLRFWSSDCASLTAPGRADAWLSLFGRLTAGSIGLLDREAARGLFIDPEWMGCENPPRGVREALAVAGDIARRDIEAIPGSAGRYLEAAGSPTQAHNPLNELAYLSGLAALLAGGENWQAELFAFEYLGAVALSERGRFQRDVLEAYRLAQAREAR